MRVVLQRVSSASVAVAGETIGAIDQGLLALVGVAPNDADAQLLWMVEKVLGLRIFADAEKPMNRSLLDLDAVAEPAGILIVSQFTLTADTRRGKRPSFTTAAPPQHALHIYNKFVDQVEAAIAGTNISVATGEFGADMQVSLVNDGPVTFVLDRD